MTFVEEFDKRDLCDPPVILCIGLIVNRGIHAFPKSDELVSHGRDVLLRELRTELCKLMTVDVFPGDVELPLDTLFYRDAVDIKT
jgi:hypothetical protein